MRNRKWDYILVLLLFLFYRSVMVSLHGQDAKRGNSPGNYIKSYPHHLLHSFNDVIGLKSNRVIFLSAATVGLMAVSFERNLDDWVEERRLMPEFMENLGNEWGGGLVPPIFLLGIPIYEYRKKGFSETSLSIVEYVWETHAVTAAFTQVLKRIVARKRPKATDNRSFPSGHTSFAFASATILYNVYGTLPGIVGYTLAINTALSRVQGRHHYLSDVIGGATIGMVIGNGFAVSHRFEERDKAWLPEIKILPLSGNVEFCWIFG